MKRLIALALFLLPIFGSASPWLLQFYDLEEPVDSIDYITDTLPFTDTSYALKNTWGADSIYCEIRRVTTLTDKSDTVIYRAFSGDYFGNLNLIDTVAILDTTRTDTVWLGGAYTRARDLHIEVIKYDTTSVDSNVFYYETLRNR